MIAALNKSPLSADRKTAIEKDLKALATEVAAALPKPGGSFGCTFLTARGQESFSYDFGNASGNSGKELTITEHLGGSPVVAIMGVNGSRFRQCQRPPDTARPRSTWGRRIPDWLWRMGAGMGERLTHGRRDARRYAGGS